MDLKAALTELGYAKMQGDRQLQELERMRDERIVAGRRPEMELIASMADTRYRIQAYEFLANYIDRLQTAAKTVALAYSELYAEYNIHRDTPESDAIFEMLEEEYDGVQTDK